MAGILSGLGSIGNVAHGFLNQITGGAFYDIVGRTDRALQERQFEVSQDFAERQFQHSIMQDARNFHESLPSTKVQRMAEAGLHPTLAVGAHGAGSTVSAQGSMPQPMAKPQTIDALMKVASIASMVAGTAKIKAETDDVRVGTQLKSAQISQVQEAVELSKQSREVIQRRMATGDLSERHMLILTETLYEEVESSIQRRMYNDVEMEKSLALFKLEYERISHNIQKIKELGLHEHVLTTEAGAIATAIQDVIKHGLTDKGRMAQVEKWFKNERHTYEARLNNVLRGVSRYRRGGDK